MVNFSLSSNQVIPFTTSVADLSAQLSDWKREILFMHKEQMFFIQLLDQSAEFSEEGIGTDLKQLKKVFLTFWEANLVAFQEKLDAHVKTVNRFAGKKEVDERRITTLLKGQRKLQQNYFNIRKAFNDLKECAFERVDEFVDLKII